MPQLTGNKQNTLSRRELYKSQKIQESNQIYYCECGKYYLTFSALYLHTRNKHQVKLSTKRTQLNSKQQIKEGKTIITYFILPKKSQSSQSIIQMGQQQIVENRGRDRRKMDIIVVLTQYISNFLSFQNGKNKITIIQQLINYCQDVQKLNSLTNTLTPDNIAMFFNDFIISYLPTHRKFISLQIIEEAETELIRLWKWLNDNSYTTLKLLKRSYRHAQFTNDLY